MEPSVVPQLLLSALEGVRHFYRLGPARLLQVKKPNMVENVKTIRKAKANHVQVKKPNMVKNAQTKAKANHGNRSPNEACRRRWEVFIAVTRQSLTLFLHFC